MKTILKKYGMVITSGVVGVAMAITVSSCGSDSNTVTPQFQQIEQLARPGINEALLLTPAFMQGYNQGAPAFVGFDSATVGAVVAEAQTVMRVLFYSVCLTNGLLGLDAATGLKPAAVQCAATGGNIFDGANPLTGTVVTAAMKAAGDTYVSRVTSNFLPDVMRIDTSIDSSYLALCGDPTSATTPLLCGGRKLNDDVIDVTYYWLLGGADGRFTPNTVSGDATANQVYALLSDGVFYKKVAGAGQNPLSLNVGNLDVANANQGHADASATFPYAPAPY